MRVACIPSMALRIALSGRYRVRLSQRRVNKLLPRNNLKTARPPRRSCSFTTLWSTTIYITLPLGESSLSEERAMRVACIPSMALRIALSGRYRVRLSQRGE